MLPERDGSHVYVDAIPIPPECLPIREGLHCESFVGFNELVVVNRRTGFFHQLPHRVNRREEQILRLSPTHGVRRHAGDDSSSGP